ncbi:MAG: recombinase family protein [Planctomycetota bacterium]|jgi:DNA invertase Pin-like site-specific DNA recombinase
MHLTVENKIKPIHLKRNAIIYIRQSTLMQVRENIESTKQQYNLKERAISLGWDSTQVQLIDEDMGLSATSSDKRTGFQKLVAQVSLSQVGAIFGLEVSRLARSCSDWYRLLELCALGDTLIIDQDGIYNPNLYNDRLVLGLKGTLSEAEIHILKLRLWGGKLTKAKEGRLRFPLPVGFIWDDNGQIIFDPNERVVDSIRLLFNTFEQVGSAFKVVQYFTQNQLLFPKRDYRALSAGQLYWGALTHGRVLNILHNPMYAGAYAFGKSTQQASKKASKPNCGNTIRLPMEEWEVLLKDHHPGYISWETYLENKAVLEANLTWKQNTPSPPREGVALLQGIAICGCCGRKFRVRYTGNGGYYLTYECGYARVNYGISTSCPSFSGAYLDQAVSEIFLSALSEAKISISLQAFDKIEAQERLVDKQWQQRIQQAEYEAELAARRYYTVEPENRLVARTLEAEWNEKLKLQERVKQEYQAFKNEHPPRLTKEDREQIIQLANRLPVVFNSEGTSSRDKKRLLRILIQDVTLTKLKDLSKTQLTIHWKSGMTTTHFTDNPLPASEKRKTPQATIDLINQLSEQHSDHKIAEILNHRDILSANGQSFTVSKIKYLRYSRRITSTCKDLPSLRDKGPRADGSYSTRQLAEILDVDPHTIFNWRKKGIINGYQAQANSPWWFKLSSEEIDQLKTIAHDHKKSQR